MSTAKGYEIVSIDDLDQLVSNDGALVLSPLRRRIGFRPFGLNVWVAQGGRPCHRGAP